MKSYVPFPNQSPGEEVGMAATNWTLLLSQAGEGEMAAMGNHLSCASMLVIATLLILDL